MMADAKIIEIAKALKVDLNATTFSQAFVAERKYAPRFKLEEMETLHVTVVPNLQEEDIESRIHQRRDYEIDIAVQKRFNKIDEDDMDPLSLLVQEIMSHFRSTTTKIADAVWLRTRNEPIYDPEHIIRLSQFTSLITLTYRFWEEF